MSETSSLALREENICGLKRGSGGEYLGVRGMK
jgi:hypothetical protein